ncbi:MAG: hypothetical protein WBN68_04805 [Sedimenticolaceae bacterium]
MLPNEPTQTRHSETDQPMGAVEGVAQPHRDQYGQYTHEMPDETAEASARLLIRAVPLIYGGLLGGLMSNILLGLSLGLVLTMALDLRMGDKSFFRVILTPVMRRGCPLIGALVSRGARVIEGLGLPVPAVLRDLRCGPRAER